MPLEQREHASLEHALRNAGELGSPVEDSRQGHDTVAPTLADLVVHTSDLVASHLPVAFRAVEGALDPGVGADRAEHAEGAFRCRNRNTGDRLDVLVGPAARAVHDDTFHPEVAAPMRNRDLDDAGRVPVVAVQSSGAAVGGGGTVAGREAGREDSLPPRRRSSSDAERVPREPIDPSVLDAQAKSTVGEADGSGLSRV